MCTARRAITLLFLGHAHVVGTDERDQFFTHDIRSWLDHSATHTRGKEVVCTVTCRFRVPEIIVLSLFDRLPKKQVKFTRENIYRRDSFSCQYCGLEFEPRELNLDHVVPRDKGGRTSWENVVTSCIPCNTRKGNKLPQEAKMFPRGEPKAPSWRPLFSTAPRPLPCESWRHFIDLKESDVVLTD